MKHRTALKHFPKDILDLRSIKWYFVSNVGIELPV